MTKIDRRILKSQEAMKKAVIELMTEQSFDQITIQDISDRANLSRRTIYLHYTDKFDLLDKLIEAHINELQDICESATDLTYKEGNLLWFEYFEKNHLFFSTMLASKGAPYFHSRFLEFVVEELKKDMDFTNGKNNELNHEVIYQFFGTATVGIVEWWFANGMPLPPRVIAEQVGALLDRNL